MRRLIIDISSIKDTILMPPPMLPLKSLQSIASEDFQRPFFPEFFNTTSSENTIITTQSQHSASKDRFLQRKRSFLQETAFTEYSDEDTQRNDSVEERRCLNRIKFKKLPIPSTAKQIDAFVMNMVDYLSHYDDSASLPLILKTKITTRYEDYKLNGMEKRYFLIALSSMQNELVALVCQDDDNLIVDCS